MKSDEHINFSLSHIPLHRPPTRPLSSPRYTGSPEQHCRVDPGATGDQERIYAEIGLPSRPFSEIPVEELYYDSNGYILKIDSIPPKQGASSIAIVLATLPQFTAH